MNTLPLDFSVLPREETILVACSGGADSVALLLALHGAEYSCVVAHINHGTRGIENELDENFVRESCEKLEISCAVSHLQMPENSAEAALRNARYNALIAMAAEYSCPRVATAHHANDVLETMILNWLRDGGSSGWNGISPQRELARGVLLVRPMLKISREEILEFLREENCDWREDSSNESARYLRNRVRSEIVPKMVELSGGDSQRLLRQVVRGCEIMREDSQILGDLTVACLTEMTLSETVDLLIIDGVKFRDSPLALQRRVFRLAVEKLEGHTRDVSFEKIETARLHVEAGKRRAVWMWKKSLHVEWTGEMAGNRIRFKRLSAGSTTGL